MDTRRLSVAVVAAEALYRLGLAAALSETFAVLSASTFDGARRLFSQHRPDRAVIALGLPFWDATLAETCAALIGPDLATPVLALVRPDDSLAVQLAARHGACAIYDTLIPADTLRSIVTQLDPAAPDVQPSLVRFLLEDREQNGAAPAPALRPRELAAVQLLARGYTSKQIAATLGSTVKAVDLLIERATHRLGASHRTQAVAIATRRGLLS
jgi:DNA-binding NarL/FixJ family response regulator